CSPVPTQTPHLSINTAQYQLLVSSCILEHEVCVCAVVCVCVFVCDNSSICGYVKLLCVLSYFGLSMCAGIFTFTFCHLAYAFIQSDVYLFVLKYIVCVHVPLQMCTCTSLLVSFCRQFCF